ncbi:hypothetical protein MMC13_007495 [Lambiella insularis]|nr:hypothetical protein [Lambiella insularis]
MVYFKDSQAYLQQSILLLEARPTTARISTRYTLLRLNHSKSRKSKPRPASTTTGPVDPSPLPSRAYIILKTYDPVSGTCLKYRTDKAAEVGRLVAGLGRCARTMAALLTDEGAENLMGEAHEESEAMEGVVEGTTGTVNTTTKESGKEIKPLPGRVGGGGKKKKGKR